VILDLPFLLRNGVLSPRPADSFNQRKHVYRFIVFIDRAGNEALIA